MSRQARTLGIVGLAALAGWLLLALLGARVMPSWLAAWMFWLAIPVGALAVVMGLELAGAGLTPAAAALRPLLLLLPVAAVFGVVVLVRTGVLYPWGAVPPHEAAARAWFTPGFFALRTILYLAAWVVLALVFLRPPPARLGGRRGLAGAGLVLHLVVGTLAATDWAMSLDMGLGSSSFGLIVIAAQCSLALAVALLPGPARRDPAALRQLAWLTLAVLGAWAFLHFTQFLVVWSADKPREITWYQQRDGGLGGAAEWLGLAALALGLLLLAPRRLAGHPGVVAAIAGVILLAHLIEMLWLVTPSARGAFTISLADLLALAGIGGIMLAVMQAARERGMRHGRA